MKLQGAPIFKWHGKEEKQAHKDTGKNSVAEGKKESFIIEGVTYVAKSYRVAKSYENRRVLWMWQLDH